LKAKEPGILTQNEALEKLRYYCGYQERSKKQVIQKMNSLMCQPEWQETLIESLTNENYLNETRYKASFIKGKSTLKGWGPIKISQHLSFETGENVDVASLLNPDDLTKARQKLTKDLKKKLLQLQSKDSTDIFGKLFRFSLSRGFSIVDAKFFCDSIIQSKE